MFCAISGKPAKFPVLSPKSKSIFEKALIEQYVEQSGKDPITNEPLKLSELVEISQTPQQTSLVNAVNASTLNTNYSIPNLLSTLQNEWDAIMLENFQLRKQLDAFTKQLSIAYYERDSAKLIAAKTLKEKDELANEINKLTKLMGTIDEEKIIIQINDDFKEKLKQESKSYLEFTQLNKIQDKYKLPSLTKTELSKTWDITINDKIYTKIDTNSSKPIEKTLFLNDDTKTLTIVSDSQIVKTIHDVIIDSDYQLLSTNYTDDWLFYTTSINEIVAYSFNDKTSKKIKTGGNEEIIFINNHSHVANDYLLWVDNQGKIGLSSISEDITYIVQNSSQNSDKCISASLQKDGLLLAIASFDIIEIINLSNPIVEVEFFKLGTHIPGTSPITFIQMCTNGYSMEVQTTTDLMVFDLRKEIGTLLSGPIDIARSKFSILDVSGKYLTMINDNKLQIFTYKKAKKTWIADDTHVIELPQSQFDDLKILLNNSELSFLIKSGTLVSLYRAL
ncbi:hypothetical protein Kpol_388p6 [Vanderwaltozyma polyspora DSM 70294]|uniref:Pre-mRNA-processing factor 19 n=1 Tax=Vanderwaltozyma polyspora (strain ATCC 22028 / DSM 70294 / BCRC 21397 / CBS 2163 / NBRC 10782 / NRRL Y-8283 / UCD 57-17) TaxID=436907 RepID=A7TRZ5_VANPO|nr:uncharacterized protein Kpol_388p6 [Vanderwaltozyma polyspora DSM 70294]EDO14963.1 hypothetical protein Kpol_388p6 [Vanderwaltozyma polyspora DSM 70294]